MATKAQQERIDLLRRTMLIERGSRNETERWEVKFEQVTETAYKCVFYVLEIGQKGDEGAAAALLCRPRTHVMIGPQGGIAVLDIKGKHHHTMHGAIWSDVIEKQQRAKRKAIAAKKEEAHEK
jgi:hypothetical protein